MDELNPEQAVPPEIIEPMPVLSPLDSFTSKPNVLNVAPEGRNKPLPAQIQDSTLECLHRSLWRIFEQPAAEGLPCCTWLLLFLAEKEGMTMGEISGYMQEATASTTGTMDRLERADLAERFYDGGDRRKVHGRISQKGRELIQRILNIRPDEVEKAWEGMDESTRKAAVSAFEKIALALGEGWTFPALEEFVTQGSVVGLPRHIPSK